MGSSGITTSSEPSVGRRFLFLQTRQLGQQTLAGRLKPLKRYLSFGCSVAFGTKIVNQLTLASQVLFAF